MANNIAEGAVAEFINAPSGEGIGAGLKFFWDTMNGREVAKDMFGKGIEDGGKAGLKHAK